MDVGPKGPSGAHHPPIPIWSALPSPTQQRMMSQRAEEGASVFTAFLQAWESETRKPAWRRADLGTGRGCDGRRPPAPRTGVARQ